VTLIGRSNNGDVDYVIDSSNRKRRIYISRLHARLVREEQYNTHKLFDDSQNGIFVNNIKIKGKQSGGIRVRLGYGVIYMGLLWIMVFNATFNNISGISWRSVLLMEETGVPGENHRPAASC
jgi:hypothetical protein